MDYCEWGKEYLRQARYLKEYLRPLRQRLKTVRGEDYILLLRRVSMLGEMYLELYHTGDNLLKRGERE